MSPDTAVDVLIAITCTSNKFMQQYTTQYSGIITLPNFLHLNAVRISAMMPGCQERYTAYTQQSEYIMI